MVWWTALWLLTTSVLVLTLAYIQHTTPAPSQLNHQDVAVLPLPEHGTLPEHGPIRLQVVNFHEYLPKFVELSMAPGSQSKCENLGQIILMVSCDQSSSADYFLTQVWPDVPQFTMSMFEHEDLGYATLMNHIMALEAAAHCNGPSLILQSSDNCEWNFSPHEIRQQWSLLNSTCEEWDMFLPAPHVLEQSAVSNWPPQFSFRRALRSETELPMYIVTPKCARVVANRFKNVAHAAEKHGTKPPDHWDKSWYACQLSQFWVVPRTPWVTTAHQRTREQSTVFESEPQPSFMKYMRHE